MLVFEATAEFDRLLSRLQDRAAKARIVQRIESASVTGTLGRLSSHANDQNEDWRPSCTWHQDVRSRRLPRRRTNHCGIPDGRTLGSKPRCDARCNPPCRARPRHGETRRRRHLAERACTRHLSRAPSHAKTPSSRSSARWACGSRRRQSDRLASPSTRWGQYGDAPTGNAQATSAQFGDNMGTTRHQKRRHIRKLTCVSY